MCNEEGIYVSKYCQQNGFNACALMITGFPGEFHDYDKKDVAEESNYNLLLMSRFFK